MLVEMIETTPNTWAWRDTSGLEWAITISANDKPVEAKSTSSIKRVIKLKEAGFTSDEIIEMSKEGVV